MLFQQNFMLQDLVRSGAAFPLFALFALLPGYLVAHMANLLDFRSQSRVDQWAISIVTSMGTVPVTLYLAGHFASFGGMWVVLAMTWIGSVVVAARTLRPAGLPWRLAGGACAVALLLVVTLADLQWGPYLISSFVEMDYVKHVAIIGAMFRQGADGTNPFFYPGHAVGLFYYPFWHLVCSLVERIGTPLVPARAAMLAGVPWVAFSLAAVVRLYVRRFAPQMPGNAVLTACLMLLVSGLDIVPATILNVLAVLRHHGQLYMHIENWNVQVASWMASVIWVPHHVVGLVANLAGILLLRTSAGRPVALVVAGFCFASGIGASLWVSLVCAIACAVWICVCILEDRRAEAVQFLGAEVVSGMLILPYILHLRAVDQVHATPVAFEVRGFGPLMDLLAGRPELVREAVDLAVLPLNYFLEFGVYAVAAVIWIGRMRRREWILDVNDRLAIVFVSVSLLIVTFFKAAVATNDLGYRGMLPAQFFLLLWTVRVVQEGGWTRGFRFANYRPLTSYALVACMALGLLTVAWDWLGTRFSAIAGKPVRIRKELAQADDTRAAYEYLRQRLPREAITQHNPDIPEAFGYGLYGERQVVAADWMHGPLLAIPKDDYQTLAAAVTPVFGVGATPQMAAALCAKYSIDALVVTAGDPVWDDPKGWARQLTPDLALNSVRVYLTPGITAAQGAGAQ